MSGSKATPAVAINKSFFASFIGLPSRMQTKVNVFLNKFMSNPRSPGIHLEAIKNAKDSKLYSARIDQKYRAIVAFDDASNTYMLVHVDNHEAAYQWAVTKHVEVNPYTRSIQLYDEAPEEERLKASGPYAASSNVASQPSVPDTTTEPRVQETVTTISTSSSPNAFAKPTPISAPVQRTSPSVRHAGPLPADYLALSENDMRRLGVPDMYVPVMLNQTTWDRFQEWSRRLPEEARVYLQLIAEGQSRSEVLSMAAESSESSASLGLEKTLPTSAISNNVLAQKAGASDDADISAESPNQPELSFRDALSTYGTQQEFVVVQGEEDLKRILDAPLEQWRVFLHPSQRGYVERNYHGPFRLLGGAGTGKTVVAMHRAKRLAAQLLKNHSNQKVLFTTYSKNLATDISSNLRLICTPDEMKMIDVINLDSFVYRYLRDKRYGYAIWYDGDDWHTSLDEIWRRAVQDVYTDTLRGVSTNFLKDEWSQVIIPQQVSSINEYLHVARRGRGTRLSRAQKIAIWNATARYQQLMKDERACDIDMAMNMVAQLLKQNPQHRYAHIVVDEGQDFSVPAYRILRALVDEHDNDLFIVGDAQQRIYGRTVVLSKCGINITGRARRLTINYRTTEEIRSAADRVFEESGSNVAESVFAAVSGKAIENGTPVVFDDLNGSTDQGGDSRSLINGPAPQVKRFATRQEEIDFVEQWIFNKCGTAANASSGEENGSAEDNAIAAKNICVVARNGDLVKKWHETLNDDLPYGAYRLDKNEDDRQEPGIRVATMHRVKGLEFDYVIIVDVEDGVCPPRTALNQAADENAREALYKQERSLIYVSLTRARKEVLLLGR
ncbi:ATP-dependent helicase [Bifidobacterium imperatoris]|uniref:DNA 3'-5' helicase n=1 Tax=Bifidobacterium imperatoris TaxID=2020965 RepID=A0A2N5IT81_9BIFI|nr:ATP-dependent helicase [Bifidobacterium imperatoris]PLS25160.1 UvrD/REP helicase [Bifidobacterium imperatoris]QSY57725.1 ATP-dependent helicase [Bifidobacterium imperatoris]